MAMIVEEKSRFSRLIRVKKTGEEKAQEHAADEDDEEETDALDRVEQARAAADRPRTRDSGRGRGGGVDAHLLSLSHPLVARLSTASGEISARGSSPATLPERITITRSDRAITSGISE
ncbi:MAG TPA: hypothetical protein VFK86_17585, partial [Bauldia sp.]|nr:hypothetical protein [Bauldia sp.]